MSARNLQVRMKRHPNGMVVEDDFSIVEADMPSVEPGQALVRNLFLSLDPYMRPRMDPVRSYVDPLKPGDLMPGATVGEVIDSKAEDLPKGTLVGTFLGWQTHGIVTKAGVRVIDRALGSPSSALGVLGMTGVTAHYGMLALAKPKAGETVVVTAASGAVGSIAGQIAKLKGCHVIGIAGGPAKCRYVVEELGFDACVDYKGGNLASDLNAAAPNGIDVYFENVGGEILDTVLLQMNIFGRIPVCGLISAYNATSVPEGPKNLRVVLTQRLTMQGLIVFDWADRVPEAIRELGAWHKAGKLKIREDVRTGGIDAYPDVLNLLYTSGNNGKLVLKV